MGLFNKTTEELDTMHKCLMRSSATRNTPLVTEIEEEIKSRVKQKENH